MRAALIAAAALLAAAACSGKSGDTTTFPAPVTERPGPLYVAIGASETVGAGAREPLRDAWPKVLFRTGLPRGATFVNLGVPGATVAEALHQQAPYAVSLRPDLATVWLNVNDLVANVSVRAYERDARELLSRLRRAGVDEILMANTPPLTNLPAYRACRPDPPRGPPCFADRLLPPPRVVDSRVAAYNAAIARVAAQEEARLVDLHSLALDLEPRNASVDLVSDDGFHPSTAGHRAVAEAFVDALKSEQ